jgi:putative Holliday junction resolvase
VRRVRVLGIDLGSKRIGVAVSDATGMLASPLTVLQRTGDPAADHRALADLVRQEEAQRVVVGLPLSLSGAVGPAARAALEEAAAMADVVGVPVETFDERLTTVQAGRSMIDQQLRAKTRKQIIDKVAAAVMLQAWLESRAAS